MLEDELSQERMDREHQRHRIDELESRLSTAMDELEHIKFVFLFDFYFDAKTWHNFMCFAMHPIQVLNNVYERVHVEVWFIPDWYR